MRGKTDFGWWGSRIARASFLGLLLPRWSVFHMGEIGDAMHNLERNSVDKAIIVLDGPRNNL